MRVSGMMRRLLTKSTLGIRVAALVCCLNFLLPQTGLSEEWHRIKAVIDGDTLLLSNGRFVRYIGINAPEIAIPSRKKPGEPFGEAASSYNADLVGRGRVRLEYDRQKAGHYGRLLAYVYNEKGIFINQAMISAGMAYCLYKKPNLKHFDKLMVAQIKAMKASKGIWMKLGRTGGAVTGNRRSKRFHRPDCPNASRMSAKNRVRFVTQWQAFKKGYSPAKGCLGGMPVESR